MKQNKIDFNKIKKLSLHPAFPQKNYLAPKEAGLSYFRYRVLRPLLKFYYRSFRLYKGVTPWTSQASVAIFDLILNKNMTGFEWGSGSSTVFFAQRLKKLISVEHNESWFKKVESSIKEKNLKNVDYSFIKIDYPDRDLDKDGFQVAFNEKQKEAYKPYFSFIDQFPDEHFDFIMVDGRTRAECGKHAIPKLKPGGILVLDNSERPRYQPLKDELRNWHYVWTTTGLTDTTIWIKPSLPKKS